MIKLLKTDMCHISVKLIILPDLTEQKYQSPLKSPVRWREAEILHFSTPDDPLGVKAWEHCAEDINAVELQKAKQIGNFRPYGTYF